PPLPARRPLFRRFPRSSPRSRCGTNGCSETRPQPPSPRETPMGRSRRIAGSRILITGASQGIGRALALEAAKSGGKVLAAARSEELLAELVAEAAAAGHPIGTVRADVTDAADRQRMADEAVRQFGGLDVLVNNAGI